MSRRRHDLRRVLSDRDDGQLTLLVVIYTLIAALLVTVVVNASRAYLFQRSLAGAADGAAISAAGGVDLGVIYSTGASDALPLAEAAARDRVDRYAGAAGLPAQFPGFRIDAVRVGGRQVTVTFTGRLQLPFLNLLSARYADGLPISATATAEAPFTAP